MESKSHKVCRKCNIEKELCEFNKNKLSKDGLSCYCKECRKLQTNEYREKNREKLKNSSAEFRKNNVDKVKNSKKKYYLEHYEKIKEKRKEYYSVDVNKNKLLLYREKNRDILRKQSVEYRQKNLEKRRNFERNYYNNRYKNDILYKIRMNIRRRIREFLKMKGMCKNNTTLNLVGCSTEELKLYLERKFTEGMNWENHGLYGWHIDHIIPLNSVKNEEDLYKLCHYTNLQPLWWWDNLKKRDKIPPLPDNTLHIV